MTSESNCQPSSLPSSSSPVMNSSDYHQIPQKSKRRNLFYRIFGKLHATPFIYTDELKQYSVNGCNVNNNGRAVITKT
jgi:hypothetical protein